MNIEIHSGENKGKLDNERIWLKVTADVADLAFFAVTDTTYTDDGKISNELRHIFWFPAGSAKKNDWLCVYTKNGTNGTSTNKDGSTTRTYYWNLGVTVWNKGKDQAVLFHLNGWTSKAV